jgi:hypothetical protein
VNEFYLFGGLWALKTFSVLTWFVAAISERAQYLCCDHHEVTMGEELQKVHLVSYSCLQNVRQNVLIVLRGPQPSLAAGQETVRCCSGGCTEQR